MTDYKHTFDCRWYQTDFHRALINREKDRLIAIWHRRAGKEETVLNAMCELALKDPGTYWHCFPEQKQARKAIWNGVNGNTGKRRIFEIFPEIIIKRMQDNDMFLELDGGSTFQLIGSDRYDSTVGSGPKGICYSEWALSNPAAWAYHSPMIRESKGFAAFITTPRGDNHAKTMYDRAVNNPDWFAELLTINDTMTLSPEVLKEALEEYQDLHGMELGLAFFEQEYLCSFSGAMVGSYFGAEMARAGRENRICRVPIDENYPVHTVWDLGKAVNNPIWCFQVIGTELHIVDFYIPETEDLDDWCAELDRRGYHGNDYVPHDILTTEWGQKKTRIERLREAGRKPVRIPRVSVADGLQAARSAINVAVFDRDNCKHGIDGLKAFRREWDPDLKTFLANPVKDWAEHIGSAFRYLGLCWREAPAEDITKPEPTELVYKVGPGGVIQGNMSPKQAIGAMIKRRKNHD